MSTTLIGYSSHRASTTQPRIMYGEAGPTVGEIEILQPRPCLVAYRDGPTRAKPSERLPVGEVLAAIDKVRASGARVLLLTIDSLGGHLDAWLMVWAALRDFSRDGRTVVTHVLGSAGSSAANIALAGDIVLMEPGSQFVIHGNGFNLPTPDGVQFELIPPDLGDLNLRSTLAVMETRTTTPRETLLECLSCGPGSGNGKPEAAIIDAKTAPALGWADFVVPREQGVGLAMLLATGADLPWSDRRRALASRPASEEWTADLQGIETRAAELRARMVGPWVQTSAPVVCAELAAGCIVADKIPAHVITVDKLSVGQLNENMWPNGSSEADPPPGADTTTAEFAYRDPAAAYVGTCGRRITSAAGQYDWGFYLNCTPGESFALRAWMRIVTDYGSGGGYPFLIFYNAAGAETGRAEWPAAISGSWAARTCWGTAPAGTTKALAIFVVANATVDIDGIVLRRMTDSDSIVPLTWTDLPVNGSWSRMTGGQYTKTLDGTVRFRGGFAASSGASSQIGTLPVGCRPSTLRQFASVDNLGDHRCVYVTNTGGVAVYDGTPVVGRTYYFDGVSFVAEQ